MSLSQGSGIWLDVVKSLRDRADFIRAACVLEATAPKVGNVHPSAHFDDLTFDHFVAAAESTAAVMGDLRGVESLGPLIRSAVRASRQANGTNVNLGIILLLGPLLAGEPQSRLERSEKDWLSGIHEILSQMTPSHGGYVASAIAEAQAGGLESPEVSEESSLNLNRVVVDQLTPPPYDLIEAMRVSADRDRIAFQYASGFQDLFETVVPAIRQSVEEVGELLGGIVLAHIRLISESGDSLIARKCGIGESQRVQGLAQRCLESYGPRSIAELDRALRSDGHRHNPGTTADLIAAGLYVCLRSEA